MAMRLRTQRESQDDQGNWQLSFADMMVLLMCTFAVILSVSVVDLDRYKHIAETVQQALGVAQPATSPTQTPEQFKQELEQVMELSRQDGIYLETRPEGVAVYMKGGANFQEASAQLTDSAAQALDRLAQTLSHTSHQLVIEGHSDDQPIHTELYPSNWELSAARAGSVARLLSEQGIPRERMVVVGYNDTRPLAPNRDPEGRPLEDNRALNRRVVVVLKNPSPAASQPTDPDTKPVAGAPAGAAAANAPAPSASSPQGQAVSASRVVGTIPRQ